MSIRRLQNAGQRRRGGAAGSATSPAAARRQRAAAGLWPVRYSAALTLAASCPTVTSSPMAPPDSVVLAELAPPYYSLQVSADGEQWVAVFADTAELTLKLARGPLAATEAAVSSVTTIDRIDVPPGINPYLGRHAYFQHAGVEHLFYSDQELADVRVTKWVHREAAGAAQWTVDLLPEAVLPVAVLPAAAEQRFTLFGVVDTPHGEAHGEAVVAYEVRPEDVADPDGRGRRRQAPDHDRPGADGVGRRRRAGAERLCLRRAQRIRRGRTAPGWCWWRTRRSRNGSPCRAARQRPPARRLSAAGPGGC